jgi:hypothetical protein
MSHPEGDTPGISSTGNRPSKWLHMGNVQGGGVRRKPLANRSEKTRRNSYLWLAYFNSSYKRRKNFSDKTDKTLQKRAEERRATFLLALAMKKKSSSCLGIQKMSKYDSREVSIDVEYKSCSTDQHAYRTTAVPPLIMPHNLHGSVLQKCDG